MEIKLASFVQKKKKTKTSHARKRFRLTETQGNEIMYINATHG